MASRYLNNITINDAYTLPSADGTNGQIITTDGSGILSFADAAASDAIVLTVKNVSGGSLSKGTVVYVSPSANPPSGNVIEVSAADNSSASTMPALAVLNATLADDAEGEAIAFGQLSGIDTSAFTAGDAIYVNTSGGFTSTKPTGAALIQKLGMVVKSHASNGTIKIFGAFRSNDVPNILQDYIWLGNSSGVAAPTEHLLNNVKDVTTSSPTDGQVLTWDNTNSYWKNADATGGGGGGELSIERDVFTATADQTAFTISSSITASSNTQVYIDGVYQAKDNYTTSGSVVTFSTGVPLGAEVEVVHFISVLSKVYTDTFTGDGTDTTFDASKDVTDENVTQIYIDGVYQSKDNYTTSGVTITFSTAPPDGSAIEVVHFTSATYSSLNSNQFTGTGSQTDFTLSQEVVEDKSFVFIQGIYQEKSTYSIDGTTLTFTTAPTDGSTIEVITVGSVSVSEANGISWQSSIKAADFPAVAGQGYFVNTTSGAITVTLPSSPSLGNEVHIVDYAGTADTNNITITSSDNINGSSNDVLINYERGGVSMVYVDATQGWIAYNAANETAEALIDIPNTITVDYLVIAGGGSGGNNYGAGGGAGGYRASYNSETSGGGASSETALTLDPSTNYTVTVGAGGAGQSTLNTKGNNGSNSVFATITSNGGGFGNGNVGVGGASSGGNGGSGGGGHYQDGGRSGGAGTTNQGYAGGNAVAGSPYTAGGGGGAGSVGGNGTSSSSGSGGSGVASTITGSSVTRAGGGGGGYAQDLNKAAGGGGSGGGGAGGATSSGAGGNGADNTGSGGGGTGGQNSNGSNSGTGGSGVVIIRYPNTKTVTIGSGLTGTTATDGSDKVTTFTAGTGNISFS